MAWAVSIALVVIISGLMLAFPGSLTPPKASASSTSGIQSATAPDQSISDGQTLTITSPVHSVLTDTIGYAPEHGGTRTYWINLSASVDVASETLALTTFPITQWGLPLQMPGGMDALPPLSLWSFTIFSKGVNETALWSVTAWDEMLTLHTNWSSQSFKVVGTTDPQVTVSVNPTRTDGTTTPGTGFVVNTPGVYGSIPTNDTDFTPLITALHPSIIRISTHLEDVSINWNTVTNQPKYNFSLFDQWVQIAESLHAQVYLSLPAGTWGDGNDLPNGMPVNDSLLVTSSAGSGYFPQEQAWQEWVEGIVNHTVSLGENITYWNIGNEVPTYSTTEVAAFTNVFNIASKVITAQLPRALVGSDVMMAQGFENYFAANAHHVGFLAFHYYPALGICFNNGVYCPPGEPKGSTDQGLFSHTAYEFMGRFYSPAAGRSLWHNITGHWLPAINAETNLNAMGGNTASGATGTDPRQQTLFGASWLVSSLIEGASQNVSGLLYFALSSGYGIPDTNTSPYGGWGFGMSREAGNNTDVRYAPYYALEMWSQAIPAGEPGVWTNSSASSVVESYAAVNGTNISVVLVNRANVPVTVKLQLVSGNYTLGNVTALDQRTYNETYLPSENTTVLSGPGTQTIHPGKGGSFVIDGYGVATATYVSQSDNGSSGGSGGGNSSGSGNSTGGGGGNSTGGGGGNSTGGGGGNSTGGGGGNTTGGGGGNTTGGGGGNTTGGGGGQNSSGPTGPGTPNGGTGASVPNTAGDVGKFDLGRASLFQQLLIMGTILALGATSGGWAIFLKSWRRDK